MTSGSSGHAGKPPFRCGFCGRQFSSFLFLVEHKMRLKYSHFYCRRCRLDFPTAAELYQHLDTPFQTVAFEGGGVRCLRCNLDHATMSDFDSHFSGKHPHGCKHCHLDFHNTRGLQKHLETAHPGMASASAQNESVEQVTLNRDSATESTEALEVQQVTPEPVTEHPDPIDPSSSLIDEHIAPENENSTDRGVDSLPARPLASLPDTRGSVPQSTNSDSAQSSSTNPSTSASSGEADQQPSATPSPEEIPEESCSSTHQDLEETTVVEQEGEETSTNAPQPVVPEAVSRRPRYPYFCRICGVGFASEEVLRQHLDHSSSAIPHLRMPGGGFRCFVCLRTFSNLNAMKKHLSYPERRHQYVLAKWCIPCLLQFHTHNGLQKHVDAVHAPRSPQERQKSSVNNGESESLSAQVASISLETPESPMTPTQTSDPAVPEMSPLDRLFASLSYSPANSPQEAGTVDTPPPIPPPQGDGQNSADATDISAGTETQEPIPSSPPEEADTSLDPDSASSVTPGPPAQASLTATPDTLYCRKCRLAFANSQEQRDHVRNGMSAIKAAAYDPDGLICAQCNKFFPNIRAMKSHLRFHELTCQDCLLYFHTFWALRAHMQSLHTANSSSGDDPPAEEPRSQPNISETTETVEALPSEPLPSASSETILPTPPPGLSTPTPTPTAPPPSTRDHRPYRPQSSSRPLPTLCRRCQVTFSTHQELREHLQNGMSAIIPDENNEGNLVCVQCKASLQDIHAMKTHLRSHETTCVECLIYFHGPHRLHDHQVSLHSTNAVRDGGPANEQAQSQPSVTTHPLPGPRPATPVAEAPNLSSPPQQPRPTIRAHQTVPRNHRTVRQISLQDFSDTDEDDSPSDIDNSQLGGWQESDSQRQRRPDANAYSVRTGGNVLGRSTRSRDRRTAEGQEFWWGGPPPPASWDDLASGRVPQDPGSIKLATSSKADSLRPKAPRVSSVAIPCSVCLEEAAVDLTSTPCGHVGCETCLRQAVKAKPECPICRKATRLSDLRPLFL